MEADNGDAEADWEDRLNQVMQSRGRRPKFSFFAFTATHKAFHTMYVDKRLDGLQAVQTLSRLNRMIPRKYAPFVLDFINEAEDIFRAFKPYYDKTGVQEASDPSQLERLKHELDQAQIYHWE